MAYTITLTDGTIFATVANETVDTSSSMTLVGRNVANYGEILDQNYIRLLESGATEDTSTPAAPLTGQVWFDRTASTLKVFDGTNFKNLGAANPAATEPAAVDSSLGDIWFNTVTEQTYIFNDTDYVLIGQTTPLGTQPSDPVVTTISDGGTDHVVVEYFVDGTRVAITSIDAEFTPSPAETGFATIKPGYNLSTDIANARFTGTATHALQADNATTADSATTAGSATTAATATNALSLGGVLAANYLRNDQSGSITGALDVESDSGIRVGVSNTGVLKTVLGDLVLQNTDSNSNIQFQVSVGGTPTAAITIVGTTGKATVIAPVADGDIANQGYVKSWGAGNYVELAGDEMTGDLSLAAGHQVLADVGQAVAPAYAFKGDTNTGMFWAGADTLAFGTNSSTRLLIASNGLITENLTAASYAALVVSDGTNKAIPNKQYISDVVTAAANVFVGVDFPAIVWQSIRTDVTSGWTTLTVNANAKFAFVSGYSFGIWGTGGGTIRVLTRKKGLSGSAYDRWVITGGGGAVGSGFGFDAVYGGSKLVECDAFGRIETYVYSTGSPTAPAAYVKVEGWIE